MVPVVRVELTCLAAVDFELPGSTVLVHRQDEAILWKTELLKRCSMCSKVEHLFHVVDVTANF